MLIGFIEGYNIGGNTIGKGLYEVYRGGTSDQLRLDDNLNTTTELKVKELKTMITPSSPCSTSFRIL